MSVVARIRSWFRPPIEKVKDPLELAQRYRERGMSIGENTQIYPSVRFGSGGHDPIRIGRDCVLTGCTILAHDASTNRALGLRTSIRKPVIIEDGCFIGINATVVMGVRVGANAIVAAGAVVTKDVPPGSVVGGNPARVITTVDELVGRRRELAREHPEYFTEQPR